MPVQKSDIVNAPYAIEYMSIGETWKIANGVSVFGNEIGVYSMLVDSTLKNGGTIGGNGAGVVFDAGGAVSVYNVKNGANGTIGGAEAGVAIVDFAGSAVVKNKGDISGGFGAIIFQDASTAVTVKNEGKVSGAFYGIGIDANVMGSTGPVVDNSGKIKAGLLAVDFSTNSLEYLATLNNQKGGLIKSAATAVSSEVQLDFMNKGKVVGSVLGSEFDDKVINKGKINGDVALGDGNDIFKNKGKATSGLIDTGDGNDVVVLGKKADKLLFASDLDALTNVDTVKKFDSGHDKLLLNIDIFTELTPGTLSSSQFHKGTAAVDADDRIIYDKASGALYYDPDGTGAAAQVQFADLGAATKLKASDIKAGYDMVETGIFMV